MPYTLHFHYLDDTYPISRKHQRRQTLPAEVTRMQMEQPDRFKSGTGFALGKRLVWKVIRTNSGGNCEKRDLTFAFRKMDKNT